MCHPFICHQNVYFNLSRAPTFVWASLRNLFTFIPPSCLHGQPTPKAVLFLHAYVFWFPASRNRFCVLSSVIAYNNCNKCGQTACSVCGDKVQKGGYLDASTRLYFFSWLFALVIGLSSYFYALRVTIFLSIAIALLCVVTSTICYMKIYLKLRNHHAKLQFQQQELARKGIPINVARYRKTVSNAVWVQSTLLVCYLPYGILTVKSVFIRVDLKSDPAWHATLCLVFLNSSLNPFL